MKTHLLLEVEKRWQWAAIGKPGIWITQVIKESMGTCFQLKKKKRDEKFSSRETRNIQNFYRRDRTANKFSDKLVDKSSKLKQSSNSNKVNTDNYLNYVNAKNTV